MKYFRRCAVVLFLLPITAVLTGSALADTTRMKFDGPGNNFRGVYTHSSLFSPKAKNFSSYRLGGAFGIHNGQPHLAATSHLAFIGPVFHEPIKVTQRGDLPQGTICPVQVPEPGEASLLLSLVVFAIIFLSVRKWLGLRIVAPVQ